MDKKINIGLFIDTFFPMIDGVVLTVDNYAKRLQKYADVTVFTTGEGELPKVNYKIVRCKAINTKIGDYKIPLPDFDLEFKRELEKSNLDIVHIHSPFFIGRLGIEYAKKHNIPLIGTMHSQYQQDFKRTLKLNKLAKVPLKKIIKWFNECDECWAVNEKLADIFYEQYGYKERPGIQYNGTDLLPIKNKKQADEYIDEKYNIDKNQKVLIFVGRLSILKNILFIVDVLKVLKENNFNFKMLYVGSGPDEEKLKRKIKKNKLEENIILCGKVENRELIKAIYSRADLFLFPSLYDSSSLVQIEAASQKTPTLFIEGATTAATITEDINGFVAKNNVNEYANKIIDILNNKDLYNTVSENAFSQIYKTWDDVIKDVYLRYQKIIKNKTKNFGI